MKKFVFRLDSVLRFRETKLEIEKAKLARLVAEEQNILRKISDLSEQCWLQNESIRVLSTLRSGDLRAVSAYVLSSQAQIITLREILADVQETIAAQRNNVRTAEQNLKVILKLKEKRASEWAYAHNRHLEAAAQDAWLATHYKRSSAAPAESSFGS